MALCFNRVLTAELDVAVGLVGLPFNYAKDIERQGRLAVGSVFNCYRSAQLPIPLPLLYHEFEDFCLRCIGTAEIPVRTSLFTLEWCNKMQHFDPKEIHRLLAIAKLVHEYLNGHLSGMLTLSKAKASLMSKLRYALTTKVACTCAMSLSKPVFLHHHKLIAMLSIQLIDLHTHSKRWGCRLQGISSLWFTWKSKVRQATLGMHSKREWLFSTGLCKRQVHVIMADLQTSSASHSE